MDDEQIKNMIEKGLASIEPGLPGIPAFQANTLFRWWEMMHNTLPLLTDKSWWEYYTDDVMRN